jgi:zinc protease
MKRGLRCAAVAVLVPLAGVRSQAPKPSTALNSDTTTSSFNVNGLQVILRRNTSNDVVAANVYLLGGTQQLTPARQGIESFLLHAAERGTGRFPGELGRDLILGLGSRVVIEPSADWTLYGVTATRSSFDSTWAMFADRLTEPTLDSAAVELVRRQMISAVRQAQTSPDPLLNHLADSLLYVGHPYGFAPEGNESSLRSISLAQLRNYQATQMVTSRMLLVVVGNVDRPEVERLVQQTLGTMPPGSYTWSFPHAAPRLGRAAVIKQLSLPTNYILGYYAGPAADDSDYQALRVADAVLAGRFFSEIRSRRNLSYDVDAPFIERAISNGGVYVTTVDPNTTLQLMRTEIDRLQREVIDPQGLERLIQQFITDYFLKNETNGDQATFLARAAIYHGDYHAASHFVADLRRVTPDDVRRVARTYMHDFRFVYLGNPAVLSRALLDQF